MTENNFLFPSNNLNTVRYSNTELDRLRALELQNQEQNNIGYPLAMDYSTNVNQGMSLMGNNLGSGPLDVGTKSITQPTTMSLPLSSNQMQVTAPITYNQDKVELNRFEPKQDLFGLAGQLYGSGYLGTGTSQMYSTPYYLHNLGRSIRGGAGIGAGRQGFGIVGNSLLSLASGARDILGGMGAQNIQNFLKQEGTNKKINSMRQGYGYSTNRNNEAIGYQGMQDGGQIEGSQEPNPNDIIMAYAQSKGLSEEQLNQLIQQLQGLPEEDQMMALQEMMADLQGGTEQGMMQEGGEYRYPKVDNTRMQTIRVPDNIRNRSLTQEELAALAHQKRGMGRFGPTSYVKSSDPILNRNAALTPQEQKDLYDYMDKENFLESIYQGLPNMGRVLGEGYSAADLPANSRLKTRFQEGGEMGGQADAQMEQLQQQVAQALQQGTDPNQVIQQLVQMGLPQDQAVAMVQQIMQALEQGQAQAPAPAMKRGGKVKKIIML